MGEEEHEGLADFRRYVDLDTRHRIAVTFVAYEAANVTGVPIEDKDPDTYIRTTPDVTWHHGAGPPQDRRIAALRQGVRRAGADVFGSVARGEATDGSDIDVLDVLSDPSIGMRFFGFQRVWPSTSGGSRRVDLVPKHYLSRVIRDHVLAEARPVYAAA